MSNPIVLVVEEDMAVRATLERIIDDLGWAYRVAGSARESLDYLRNQAAEVLLVDSRIEGTDSASYLRKVTKLRPETVPVVIGLDPDSARVKTVFDAGAFDTMSGRPDDQMIENTLRRAMKQHRLLVELRHLHDDRRGRSGYQKLVGRSDIMERLRGVLERSAASEAGVLFLGPGGSGKELAARILHSESNRSDRPFISLDCATFPEHLIGDELFGRTARKSGPSMDVPGLLESARGGVLFLDEVGRLPLEVQIRLVEVLRGSPRDIRILCASSDDLGGAVKAGLFREDLLDALVQASITLTALHERKEDIPVLARHFLDTICRINELPPIRLTPHALDILIEYHWPGNIRELRNAMEQAAILATDSLVQPGDLPKTVLDGVPLQDREDGIDTTQGFRAAKKVIVDRFENSYLTELLQQHTGNVTAAANKAGMLRSALQRLLRKHKLHSAEFRKSRSRRKATAHKHVER